MNLYSYIWIFGFVLWYTIGHMHNRFNLDLALYGYILCMLVYIDDCKNHIYGLRHSSSFIVYDVLYIIHIYWSLKNISQLRESWYAHVDWIHKSGFLIATGFLFFVQPPKICGFFLNNNNNDNNWRLLIMF